MVPSQEHKRAIEIFTDEADEIHTETLKIWDHDIKDTTEKILVTAVFENC